MTKVSEPELHYTGLDILQALENATNYNALLTDLILESAHDDRSMLDFGAGVGTFAKLLRRDGIEVTCLENDPYLAEQLASQDFSTLTQLEQLQNESLHFVFSLNVFEHIEDDANALRILAQKLRAGGKLFVYVPAFECLWTSLDDKVKHYRRYRRRGLAKLAESAGLRVCGSSYVDSLGFVAALVFKLIGNKQGDLTPRSISFYDRYIIPPSKFLDRFFHPLFGKNVYVVCEKV